MHQLIGLISRVVVATVLVGIATGCTRFPFGGSNQSANQTGNSSDTTQNQPGTRTPALRANQPTRQAQNNPNNAQSPDGTLNPEAPNTGAGQSGANQGVPALW
ncbi:MAG TPA: hypothetical protein V6D26_04775 [Stenomitos sp.]